LLYSIVPRQGKELIALGATSGASPQVLQTCDMVIPCINDAAVKEIFESENGCYLRIILTNSSSI
jgi:hypothetical protein